MAQGSVGAPGAALTPIASANYLPRNNTVNPFFDGKYVAPAAAKGKLAVEFDISPSLAQQGG